MKTKSNKKNHFERHECLDPKQLAYLLLISSVITGCTQKVEKLPEYQQVLSMCKTDPKYCEESEKLDQQLAPNSSGASGSFDTAPRTSGNGNFLSHYLLYHMLFSRNNSYPSNYSGSAFNRRTLNLSDDKVKERGEQYSGRGVYSPGFVSRMNRSISEGKTSFVSDSGKVFKSSQFKGSSRSSITGKSISRGGFGSSGRSFGVGHS